MVIRVKLMLAHFFRILVPNFVFGHFLAHSRIQLTHLRALFHTIPQTLQVVRGLDRASSGRGPDRQWLQRSIGATSFDKLPAFVLSMFDEGIAHFLGVRNAILGK